MHLSAILQETQHIIRPPSGEGGIQIPGDIDPPKVPIKSNLVLTGAEERRLTDLVLRRLEASITTQRFQRVSSSNSWLERRNEAMRQYLSDFSSREEVGMIFEFSNLSMNLPKRYTDITVARAFDELLGSDQLLGVTQEGSEDSKEEASVIERYCSHKIKEVKVKEVLREATIGACIRGESVVKTTWERNSVRYRKRCFVLLDNAGNFVFSADGNPVTNEDVFIEDEVGVSRLARDKAIILPQNPQYAETMGEFRKAIKSGLDITCLDHRDFVCSTVESDIHTADFCAHIFDWPSDKVRSLLGAERETEEAKEFLARMGNGASLSKLGGSWKTQPDDNKGEEERDMDAIPPHPFAECYIRCSVSEDGIADEIMVIVDVTNKQPLFYDYLGNVSPTGKRPFQVVRINPVPGRWYGTGLYEKFADRHKFVDLFFNRVNFRSSLSGNIRIENPEATEEGMAGESIEFGTNKTYHLRPGFKIDEVLQVIQVPNDAAESKNMLDLLLQTTQLEAGMVSAGDAGIGSLPSAGLATGIKSLDRIANIVLKSLLYDLVLGYERILFDAATFILAKYDRKDAVGLMGEDKARLLDRCRDISTLPYKVKIILSNARDIDIIKANEQAMQVVQQYLSIPPELQLRLRPLFVQMLTSLQIDGVDDLLPVPVLQQAVMPPQAGMVQQPPQIAYPQTLTDNRTGDGRENLAPMAAGAIQPPSPLASQQGQPENEVQAQVPPEVAAGISAGTPATAEAATGADAAGSPIPSEEQKQKP